jgi:rhodanese-related sulfurtransferase
MKNLKFKVLFLTVILTASLTVGCSSKEADTKAVDTTTQTEGSAATETKAEIKTMKGEDLVKQNSGKEKDKVLIIDVRSPEEYKAGHIQNAININIENFEKNLGQIEDLKDFPIILYCNSGKKSGQAAEILVNNGFKDVTNADGVKDFQYELIKYEELRGAEFQTLIEENKEIVLVDVRPEKQVAEEGMIAGAINVPFDAIEANLDKLPKDKTIAVYCNTGTKSADAAKVLESLEYTNVVNSIEGVKEYKFTLVK